MTDALVIATPMTAIGYLPRRCTDGHRRRCQRDRRRSRRSDRGRPGRGRRRPRGTLVTVPPQVRAAWARQATPLILSLPDEDGDVSAAKDAALRDLLARAVGYQITFTPSGGPQ